MSVTSIDLTGCEVGIGSVVGAKPHLAGHPGDVLAAQIVA